MGDYNFLDTRETGAQNLRRSGSYRHHPFRGLQYNFLHGSVFEDFALRGSVQGGNHGLRVFYSM